MKLLLICLLMNVAVYAAGVGKIAGTVVDQNGVALIGANVQIIETQQGVSVFNTDGSFVILGIAPGRYTLRVSSIGYKTETFVAVEVLDGQTADEIFAVLTEDVIEDHGGCPGFHRNMFVDLDQTYKVKKIKRAELECRVGW